MKDTVIAILYFCSHKSKVSEEVRVQNITCKSPVKLRYVCSCNSSQLLRQGRSPRMLKDLRSPVIIRRKDEEFVIG